MSRKPDLLFGPDVAAAGFTPAGIAAFSDLRPAAIVRELIQNSLDAALGEAGEPCAKVRFRRMQVRADEIPGLASYKTAFRRAERTQIKAGGGRMPTQAESVVERMKSALKDPYPQVLSVTDNGIGLDGRRMSALLSDGVSQKDASSAGTFGNGHSVVIPASDLRYVLYGGLIAEGRKIGAGQAIIASHSVSREKHPRSSHGFFIRDFQAAQHGVPHLYASGSLVPPLIDREIEWIRRNHGRGAAVIIPYFNDFHDPRPLQKMIERAAACNFFQAIHEGRLTVEVVDQTTVPEDDDDLTGHESWTVDRSTLPRILDEYREEKRIRNGAFLTGEKANEAYVTLRKGTKASIPTALGKVSLRVQRDGGNNQVSLVRNGMWITDSLPELRRRNFSDRQPFQAILLLEPTHRNALYELIQRSETPLHNDLAIKQLSVGDRRKLRAALGEVREWILEHVPAVATDSFSISGLLDVQFEGVSNGPSGSRHRSFWGTPTARRGGTPAPHGEDGEVEPPGSPSNPGVDNPKRQNDAARIVYPSLFQVASAPAGPGRQRVHIVPKRDCKDARLRMFVDENVDFTCDRQSRDDAVPVRLHDVSINGVSSPAALDQDGYAVRLGDLSEGDELLLETGYEISTQILMLPDQHPTFRVEVVRVRERALSMNDERAAKDGDG